MQEHLRSSFTKLKNLMSVFFLSTELTLLADTSVGV